MLVSRYVAAYDSQKAFSSPYESYAKTVSRFTLLREARDGEAVTLEAGREKRTPSSKRLAYGSTRT